jgi:putative CRISPR-associated protein (TIGR02620 family)
MERTIIVTRHANLIDWLALRGITGDVVSHVATPNQVAGRVVYGILPLHLAALAEEVIVVDMPRLDPELRGTDLTPAQMDAAGATLARYRVERIDTLAGVDLAGVDLATVARAADVATLDTTARYTRRAAPTDGAN